MLRQRASIEPDSSQNAGREPPFEFRKDHPIARYGRKWRRQEVQGLCFLAIEIMSLSALATVSLQALGYMDDYNEYGHIPRTISWRILREFFIYDEIPHSQRDCMLKGDGVFPPIDVDANNLFPAPLALSLEVHNHDHGSSQLQHKDDCGYHKSDSPWDWLLRLFSTHFMSVVNSITSGIFLCSISARRQKGLQAVLLVPSFLCFFMNIFQQIPTTFHFNYYTISLKDELKVALVHSQTPYRITPCMSETQIHTQCCGVERPEDWHVLGSNINFKYYPGSCCNTTAYDCAGKYLIPKEQAWSVGCMDAEDKKISKFERWGMAIFVIKVIAEVGLFCSLSDLTRYEYPPASQFENSSCDARDYHIKCRGVMRLQGITKDGRVVVESTHLMPWTIFPSRLDTLTGLIMYVKTNQNHIKGSVEISKRYNAPHFSTEDIGLDMTRKGKGIYVFSLV